MMSAYTVTVVQCNEIIVIICFDKVSVGQSEFSQNNESINSFIEGCPSTKCNDRQRNNESSRSWHADTGA